MRRYPQAKIRLAPQSTWIDVRALLPFSGSPEQAAPATGGHALSKEVLHGLKDPYSRALMAAGLDPDPELQRHKPEVTISVPAKGPSWLPFYGEIRSGNRLGKRMLPLS